MKCKHVVVGVFVGLFAFVSGVAAADDSYEMPSYKVLYTQGDIEIREYAPQLVAEVMVKGDRSSAANKGFRILADFIFGGNQPEASISMTAPVMQEVVLQEEGQPSVKTVEAVDGDENSWRIRFMMPSKYTLSTIPTPNDARIAIRELAAYRAAAIRFTGLWTQSNLEEHAQELAEFVKMHRLKTIATAAYAFYNDPFTWPWSRRNEVIVALAPDAMIKSEKTAN